MSRGGEGSRRQFLTGWLRGRELALVGVGAMVWSYALEDARGSVPSQRIQLHFEVQYTPRPG